MINFESIECQVKHILKSFGCFSQAGYDMVILKSENKPVVCRELDYDYV
jgi:translation initiation factor IF-3